MAYERLPMRKIKEVLRLKYEAGRSHGEIARSCGISHSTVLEYLRRLHAAGLTWPLPELRSPASSSFDFVGGRRSAASASGRRSVDLPPYLTASEVAAVFRWSLRKARRRLREGAFPGAFRDGLHWRVPEASVHTYRGVPAPADPAESAVADLVARFGSSAPRTNRRACS
jgi:hypothetical protein